MQVMVQDMKREQTKRKRGQKVHCKAFDYFQIRDAIWEHVSTEFDWSILDLVVTKLGIESRPPYFSPFLAQGAMPNPRPVCVRGLPSP